MSPLDLIFVGFGNVARRAVTLLGERLETVPADDPLAGLEGMQNALILKTDLLGEIAIVQRDGGLTQTAYAIVSDLARVARSAPPGPGAMRRDRIRE